MDLEIINIKIINIKINISIILMDIFTILFWIFFLLFIILSIFLLCCIKKSNLFYVQIGCGIGMFITSKIGRNFLGIE